MTVTAKADARLTARMGVRIGMTHITNSTGVSMPVPIDIMHVHRRMCPRIVTLDSIGIAVACNANRIATLYVMTRRAALYISPRIDGVSSPAGSDTIRNEIAAEVPHRLYHSAISFRIMAFHAEVTLVVACIARALASARHYPVRITEIGWVNFLGCRILIAGQRRKRRRERYVWLTGG